MIRETSLLSIIGLITLIYNHFIYPYILLIISANNHNFIVIFSLILVQIDNFSLLKEIKEKQNDNIMEEKYLKVISNQLYYICKKVDNIDNYKNQNKNRNYNNNKIFKSCGDLTSIN
jgi:hypothetical protein